MAEKHYRTIEKKTFNPDKNYFNIETIKVYREESKEEETLSHNANVCGTMELLVKVLGISGSLAALLVLSCLNLWLYGLIIFVILFPASLILGRQLEKECERFERELAEYYEKYGPLFYAEQMAEILAHNTAQELIAAEWRAAHPFEEKIRAVLNDPMSSVDIAEMAYFFADKYLKEKQETE